MSRDRNFFSWFSDDMVKTKIHFIESEHLLRFSCIDGRIFFFVITIIDFYTSKHGIFISDIDTTNIENKSVRFVSFQGWRDGEVILGISIDDVNEFLLFDSSNHKGTTFRISSQILTRDDSSNTSFAESFLMNFFEFILFTIILENDNSSWIRADNNIISIYLRKKGLRERKMRKIYSSQSERDHRSDKSKNFKRSDDLKFSTNKWELYIGNPRYLLSSARRSSRILPLATMSSWALGPEKLP